MFFSSNVDREPGLRPRLYSVFGVRMISAVGDADLEAAGLQRDRSVAACRPARPLLLLPAAGEEDDHARATTTRASGDQPLPAVPVDDQVGDHGVDGCIIEVFHGSDCLLGVGCTSITCVHGSEHLDRRPRLVRQTVRSANRSRGQLERPSTLFWPPRPWWGHGDEMERAPCPPVFRRLMAGSASLDRSGGPV